MDTSTIPFIFQHIDLRAADPTAGLSGAWQPLRDGVDIFPIYGDRTKGPSAAFLRYAPGAEVPQHRHPKMEHIFVLQGSQADENGAYRAGSLLISSPNTAHSVVSKEGCLVLAVWGDAVEFLQEAPIESD